MATPLTSCNRRRLSPVSLEKKLFLPAVAEAEASLRPLPIARAMRFVESAERPLCFFFFFRAMGAVTTSWTVDTLSLVPLSPQNGLPVYKMPFA